ncbi:ARS-binding protein 1 [Glycine max]|nr:ARS-binding protein 1 [Glycine max]
MEKVVYVWFLQHQERVNITGELILQKARDTMKLVYPHDDSNFNFSIGWLGKFKHRHGIKSFCRFGESYKLIIHWQQNNLKEENKIKKRLTVVICCNEDGFEKIPLWIIGKYAKPRCFKNVNMNNLDYQYRANKKAWMTSVLFDEYVRSFDQMMHGRRVLLVVDNCPAHQRNIEGLRNVELFFLPPNMTSKIQPCDAGIIRAFKMHYRKILKGYEVGQSDPGKINVLDAINLAIPAWTIDVRKETIANCFRHCKIRSASDVARNLDEFTFDEETQDLKTMINQCGYHNKMDIDNLMNYPGENEACSEVQSLEDIVGTIIENNANDDGEDDTVSLEPVTRKEALMASNTLHNFMIQYKNTTPELLDAIRKVRDEL